MSEIITVGLDLAKNVFQVHGADGAGRAVLRKKLRRMGYQTPAGFALRLTTAIARPAARNESSARRAIAQPASKDVNQLPAPVVAG